MIRFSKFIAEGADATLADKAKKSGFSLGILKQVYKRGMAAWKVGHKPGTTPQQWGMARVNSFITGGRTRVKGDPDLWAKQKGKIKKPKKEDVNEDPAFYKAVAKQQAADQAKRDAADPAAAARRKAAKANIAKKKPVTPDSVGRHSSQGGGFIGRRNEEVSEKHVYRFATKTKQGNIHHSSKDDAGAKKAIEKRTGEKVQSMTYKGPVVSRMSTRREDSDAVKAFLAKGGKIKKLPPGKAAGYHGKDDPGKGMHGMMDKPDTKGFKKNKFVGSMK